MTKIEKNLQLDPDPDSESGYKFTDLIESGSNPDPKLCKRVPYGSGVEPIETKGFFYRTEILFTVLVPSKSIPYRTQPDKVIVQLGCW